MLKAAGRYGLYGEPLVIHALFSENGSMDVLIIFIFYINVLGKKITGNKCQHPVDFFFFFGIAQGRNTLA